MSPTLTYKEIENWNKSLSGYNNTKLYYSHNSSNCEEYAIENNYPFYFRWDADSKTPLNDSNGNNIENKCIFRLDSSLNNFADNFFNNRYQEIEQKITTYTGPYNRDELSSFFMYKLLYNFSKLSNTIAIHIYF